MKRKSPLIKSEGSVYVASAPRDIQGGDLAALDTAGMLYNKGRLDEARQICERILAAQPRNHLAVMLWAMIERRRGDFPRAINLARHAIQLKPDYADAFINLGAIYRDYQQPDMAKEYLLQGMNLVPDHFPAHMILAAIQHDNREWDGLEKTLVRAIEIDPENPVPHRMYGGLMYKIGRLAEAESAYRRILAIRPDSIDARCRLSRIHQFYPGDPEIQELQSALTKKGFSVREGIRLKFALGRAFDQIGEYKTAFGYLRDANAEMASILPFDEAEHLRVLADIRAVYADIPAPQTFSIPAPVQVPIFIIGTSRSGKTLIESLLTRDDRVLALGEGRELLNIIDEFFHDHGLATPYPHCLNKFDFNALPELGTAYLAKIARIDPSAVFSVNTTPGHYKYVGLIMDAIPNAKIIFCRRDPMDCCMRMYFKHYKRNFAFSYDQNSVARYYAAYWHLQDFWMNRYGNRILLIRYEELVADTDASLARILDFCGINDRTSLGNTHLTTKEIGHWRHYQRELAPMLHQLKKMADLYSLPQLLPATGKNGNTSGNTADISRDIPHESIND